MPSCSYFLITNHRAIFISEANSINLPSIPSKTKSELIPGVEGGLEARRYSSPQNQKILFLYLIFFFFTCGAIYPSWLVRCERLNLELSTERCLPSPVCDGTRFDLHIYIYIYIYILLEPPESELSRSCSWSSSRTSYFCSEGLQHCL